LLLFFDWQQLYLGLVSMMFLCRGKKLALMAKKNSLSSDFVDDCDAKTCAGVSDFLSHLVKKNQI